MHEFLRSLIFVVSLFQVMLGLGNRHSVYSLPLMHSNLDYKHLNYMLGCLNTKLRGLRKGPAIRPYEMHRVFILRKCMHSPAEWTVAMPPAALTARRGTWCLQGASNNNKKRQQQSSSTGTLATLHRANPGIETNT